MNNQSQWCAVQGGQAQIERAIRARFLAEKQAETKQPLEVVEKFWED